MSMLHARAHPWSCLKQQYSHSGWGLTLNSDEHVSVVLGKLWKETNLVLIENSFLSGPLHLIKLLSFFYPTNVNWQLDQTKKKHSAAPPEIEPGSFDCRSDALTTELRSHDRNCMWIFVFHLVLASCYHRGFKSSWTAFFPFFFSASHPCHALRLSSLFFPLSKRTLSCNHGKFFERKVGDHFWDQPSGGKVRIIDINLFRELKGLGMLQLNAGLIRCVQVWVQLSYCCPGNHMLGNKLFSFGFLCSCISHQSSQDLVFSEEVYTEIIRVMQTAEMVDHLIANNVFSSISDIKQRLDSEPSHERKNALILNALYQQVKSNERVFDLFLKCFYAIHESSQQELTASVSKGTTLAMFPVGGAFLLLLPTNLTAENDHDHRFTCFDTDWAVASFTCNIAHPTAFRESNKTGSLWVSDRYLGLFCRSSDSGPVWNPRWSFQNEILVHSYFWSAARCKETTLLPRQAVGLGAPQTIVRGHRGHYEGLSRCQLVGSCVLPGENFFKKAYM